MTDLISREAALKIFQPEHSAVRKRICDDIRALPSAQEAAPAVKVKPLVWKREDGAWSGASPAGSLYLVGRYPYSSRWGWVRFEDRGANDDGWSGDFRFVQDAKNAAQADYDQRIMASLKSVYP